LPDSAVQRLGAAVRRATPAAQPPKRKKAAPKKAAPKWVDPMPSGRTTSCYGQRWGRLHAGVDVAAPAGTPVRAVGAGRVIEAGTWAGGYGISVLVDHGDGYLTHYAHLRRRQVSVGDRVAVGQQLGEEGSTGNSTGPHLHFEVHKGTWRNTVEPTGWLRARGVTIPGCG
jgi:murein DD-endopeptidase MepM/ murein hydrolase activator NlpD